MRIRELASIAATLSLNKWPLVCTIIAVWTGSLSSQDTDHRCESSRTIAFRPDLTVRRWAEILGDLKHCPESGPEAYVRLWDAPPQDSVMSVRLVNGSGNFYDERVFAKLLAVAGDPARSSTVRLGAARALFPQVRHCFFMGSISPLPPVPDGDTLFTLVSVGMVDHSYSVAGEHPRQGDVIDRILEVLRRPPEDPELRAIFSGAAKTIGMFSRSTICQD